MLAARREPLAENHPSIHTGRGIRQASSAIPILRARARAPLVVEGKRVPTLPCDCCSDNLRAAPGSTLLAHSYSRTIITLILTLTQAPAPDIKLCIDMCSRLFFVSMWGTSSFCPSLAAPFRCSTSPDDASNSLLRRPLRYPPVRRIAVLAMYMSFAPRAYVSSQSLYSRPRCDRPATTSIYIRHA